MKLTDEQYKEVGEAIADAGFSTLTQGRAAVAAVAPLVLAEAYAAPTEEEFLEFYEKAMRMRTTEGNFRGGWNACIRFFGSRLASLTAKPDPAIEAVKALMPTPHTCNGITHWESTASPEQIVAAVDAARAK